MAGSLTEPNLNDINTQLNQNKSNLDTRQTGYAGQENAFTNKYANTVNNQETNTAMYNRIGGELNLPTLQANAQSINQNVRDLPQTYSAATRGFDVNNNQLQRIVGQKTSELTPALATANEAVGTAETNRGVQMGLGQADQQRQLQPLTVEQQMLTERIARENSAYSTNDQSELNAILQKMQMGVTLSEGEKNRAAQLAQNEQQFEMQKEQLGQTQKNQVIDVGSQKYLIDPQTGQIISKYGTGGGGGASTASYFATTQMTPQSSSLPSSWRPSQ